MSELREPKLEIAVIGGGHGCYASAVSLTEQGHNVRLWRRDAAAFGSVLNTKIIKLTDHEGVRDVEIAVVTDDLAAAMQGAELIVLPLPCHTHTFLAPQLAPLWQDGQVGYLPPGTFGGYIYAKAAVDAGNTANIAFGETGTLPYLARKHGEDNVRISVYATRLPTGIYPLKDADRAPMPTHLPHTLLRRLGISPMNGKFPMVGLLETIYDDVSVAASKRRRDS